MSPAFFIFSFFFSQNIILKQYDSNVQILVDMMYFLL